MEAQIQSSAEGTDKSKIENGKIVEGALAEVDVLKRELDIIKGMIK